MPNAAPALTPTPAAESWTGWLRRRGRPWVLACTAATHDRCWRLLMAHPNGGRPCEYVVLPTGQAPRPPRKNKPRRC